MWDSEKRLKLAQEAIRNSSISEGKRRKVRGGIESVYEKSQEEIREDLEMD